MSLSPVWFDPHPAPVEPTAGTRAMARVMLVLLTAVFLTNLGWLCALAWAAASGDITGSLAAVMGWVPLALIAGAAAGMRCAEGVLREGRCPFDPRG